MSKVIVIGGGPAGMMAALSASKRHEVTLIEQNEKLGKKLFITGKGRCNITNNKDISDFFDNIPGNPHFLYSALYSFTNQDAMKFFNDLGVELKVERGDRVFPASDKSSDIIRAFERKLYSCNIEILLNSKVKDIIYKKDEIKHVVLNDNKIISGDYFIICTGGLSYPQTGSTGDGYEFAEICGHNIMQTRPALVPIEVKEDWISKLQGLSLKNIEFSIKKDSKTIFKDFGEMLFTHYGMSGPVVLSGSRLVNSKDSYTAHINLKPALTQEQLDKRILKDFEKYNNKDFANSLNDLLPKKLIDIIIDLSGIERSKKVNSITKNERRKIVELLRNLAFNIKGLRSMSEAIITVGGVDVKEIDPSTMQSKLSRNLSFAGEIVDVDGVTGGFNLQIAMSTGYLAGERIGEI